MPVDEGDDAVVAAMSAKALGVWCDVTTVCLAGRFRVFLAAGMIDGLVSRMVGVRTDTLTEPAIGIGVATAIASALFITASCAEDVRTAAALKIDSSDVVRVNAVVRASCDLVCFLTVTSVGVLARADANTVAG